MRVDRIRVDPETRPRDQIPGVIRWAAWAIERVGFPIALAAYLLFSFGAKFDRMNEKLDRVILILEARR